MIASQEHAHVAGVQATSEPAAVSVSSISPKQIYFAVIREQSDHAAGSLLSKRVRNSQLDYGSFIGNNESSGSSIRWQRSDFLIVQVGQTTYLRESKEPLWLFLMKNALSPDRPKSLRIVSEKETKAWELVEKANKADLDGEEEKSVDMIFKHFDSLLRESEFEIIDCIFSKINESAYTTDVLISMLTITLSAKDLISNRQKVYDQTKYLIESRNEPEADLLFGL